MSSSWPPARAQIPADLLGQRVPLADTVANVALLSGVSQRLTDDDNRERFQRHGLGHLDWPLVMR